MIRFGRSLGRREWAALTALGLGAGIVVMTALTSRGAEALLPELAPAARSPRRVCRRPAG